MSPGKLRTAIQLYLLTFFFSHCVQNLQKCPMDTLAYKTECEVTKKEETLRNTQIVLGLAVISTTGSSLSGKALEFYSILASYRANGTYKLTNGTTRTFANSSRCSSTVQHSALNRAAQKHTENMIRLNFFSHTGQDGSSPTDRVKAEGLNVGAGENIAAGYSTAESAFDGWWNSSGHRNNMENCSYTHVGIGYASKSSLNPNASYSDYWTNVFATIK